MKNLKFTETNITYLYDGTFNGLLTIVFDCYINKQLPLKIVDSHEYVSNLFDNIQTITTDYDKADRIFNGISENISYDVLYNSYYAFLSEDKDRELYILKYILYGFQIGPKIDTMLSIDFVYNVNFLKRRMLCESHKLKGLVRFTKIGDNLFYSSIHPSNNVVENLGHHFMKRLPTQNFIIHDKIRNIAFLYNTKNYEIVDASTLEIPEISEEEQLYQDMWTAFFKTIAIKERTNSRLQRQFMPKKYWKDIFETQA